MSPAALRDMARDYLRIARPANRQLDRANDGYQDTEHGNLRAAEADLRAEVATERRFDRQVLRLRFPAWIGLGARDLVRANSRRIELTTRQARAATLAGLQSFDHRHRAADAAVETQVRQLRNFLGLPPPATS